MQRLDELYAGDSMVELITEPRKQSNTVYSGNSVFVSPFEKSNLDHLYDSINDSIRERVIREQVLRESGITRRPNELYIRERELDSRDGFMRDDWRNDRWILTYEREE